MELFLGYWKHYYYVVLYSNLLLFYAKYLSYCRILALRKAEKEEEKRAREKIRQKLEEDKVLIVPNPEKLCVLNQLSII